MITIESILTTIKKMLGIEKEYTHFDTDIIVYINSIFSSITQLGVGPPEGFSIKDESEEWTDFIDDDPTLAFIKTYIYLKVKLVFDPPTSSAVIELINKSIGELEWRINVSAELEEE